MLAEVTMYVKEVTEHPTQADKVIVRLRPDAATTSSPPDPMAGQGSIYAFLGTKLDDYIISEPVTVTIARP